MRDDLFLEATMRAPTLGYNTAVFFLFFGVSAIDAIWTHHFLRALLWFGFGALFLLADMRDRGKENPHENSVEPTIRTSPRSGELRKR